MTAPNRSKSSPPPFYAKVLKKTKKVGLSHLPGPCWVFKRIDFGSISHLLWFLFHPLPLLLPRSCLTCDQMVWKKLGPNLWKIGPLVNKLGKNLPEVSKIMPNICPIEFKLLKKSAQGKKLCTNGEILPTLVILQCLILAWVPGFYYKDQSLVFAHCLYISWTNLQLIDWQSITSTIHCNKYCFSKKVLFLYNLVGFIYFCPVVTQVFDARMFNPVMRLNGVFEV